jgi:hypothetical protein
LSPSIVVAALPAARFTHVLPDNSFSEGKTAMRFGPGESSRETPLRYAITALAVASITAAAAQAKADIITTYNVSGTYQDGATVSGTLTMDTTTATATAIDVHVTNPGFPATYGPFDFVSSPTTFVFNTTDLSSPPADVVKVLIEPDPSISNFLQLDVVAPGFTWPTGVIPLSTITFAGPGYDSAYGVFDFTFGVGNLYESDLVSGELTPINTPEPASLTLLASGFVAVGGFGLFRRRLRASKNHD